MTEYFRVHVPNRRLGLGLPLQLLPLSHTHFTWVPRLGVVRWHPNIRVGGVCLLLVSAASCLMHCAACFSTFMRVGIVSRNLSTPAAACFWADAAAAVHQLDMRSSDSVVIEPKLVVEATFFLLITVRMWSMSHLIVALPSFPWLVLLFFLQAGY